METKGLQMRVVGLTMHVSEPALWMLLVEALAPAHIDSFFHRWCIPTQLEERKLSLETLVDPDLFTSPPNDVNGFSSTDAP